MQEAKRQLRLRLAGALALALLCLPYAGEATGVGSPVPKPTAANQYPVSAPYGAGFTWTPVTLPWLSNGSQTAFGGAIDTTSRVSVNPQGTSENGLTVKMPSGATGNALTVKDSTGATGWFINGDSINYTSAVSGSTLTLRDFRNNSSFWNGWYFPSNVYFNSDVRTNGQFNSSTGSQGFALSNSGLFGGYGASMNYRNGADWYFTSNNATFNPWPRIVIDGGSIPAQPILVIKSASGQTADLMQFQDSTGAVKAKTDKSFNAQFNGISTTGSAVNTFAGGITNVGYSVLSVLTTPTAPTFTTAATGGTLAASTTYYYRIVAVSGTGVTLGSTEASQATAAGTATNTVTLTWAATTGAESYKVYGRTTAAELLIASGITALTYTDTGGVTPAGALPTANTTGYENSASYQVNGVSGVTTTHADGSVVTGGIVTTAPTLVGTDTQTLRYNGTALTATSNQLVNTAGQTAFGGAIDTTSRVSVNPQGTGENGLTVKMPSGATGNALTLLQAGNGVGVSSVSQFGLDYFNVTALNTGQGIAANFTPNGTPSSNNYAFQFNTSSAALAPNLIMIGTAGKHVIAAGTNGVGGGVYWPLAFRAGVNNWSNLPDEFVIGDNYLSALVPMTFTSNAAAVVPATIKAASGQTADLLDITDSTNNLKVSVNKNFVMTAKGYASSVRVVTATDTATLTDSVLLWNGTFTETLPATGWPTGYRLTVKDTGTGTVTLTAGGTVTFDGATTMTFATQYKSRVLIFDGVNFQVESGLL